MTTELIDTEYRIERDDDCDCPRWLRWRVVLVLRGEVRGILVTENVERPGRAVRWHTRDVVGHTITKLGARWKRRRLER